MLTICKVGGGTWLLRTNDVKEFNISLRFPDLFQILDMPTFSLVSNCPGSDGTNHLVTLRQLMTDAETLVMCSGHLKLGGVDVLRLQLDAAIARGAKVTFYSNRPNTQRRATKALADLGIEHIVVDDSKFYLHTKLYYFEVDSKFSALIGSANITGAALQSNEELSLAIHGIVGDQQHSEIMQYLAHLDQRCRQAHAG